jgi:hypothetical protein
MSREVREVFVRDWKERKREARVDWIGRVLELLAVAFIVFCICVRW